LTNTGVDKGQWEACTALSLSPRKTYFRVILPQAIPPSIPGFGNYMVLILKDTPMLSVIGVTELMNMANSIGSENYRFLEPYTLVGLIFLGLSLPVAFFVRRFEAWVRKSLGMEKQN
jgi:polar amino acid transport system permease protein